jgi:rhodanese-related sulfurtransferase
LTSTASEAEPILLDLRRSEDFMASHIPGSLNLSLESSNVSMLSPFFDATVLQKQWQELDTTFTPDYISKYGLFGRDVYVICYKGDTARVATSVLRAKGVSASSIKGGITAVRKELPDLYIIEHVKSQEELSMKKTHVKEAAVTMQLGKGPTITIGTLKDQAAK